MKILSGLLCLLKDQSLMGGAFHFLKDLPLSGYMLPPLCLECE